MITDDELIKKKDINWKHNPLDVDSIDKGDETPEQFMSQITFKGSRNFRTN
jgi:hypothetical protein